MIQMFSGIGRYLAFGGKLLADSINDVYILPFPVSFLRGGHPPTCSYMPLMSYLSYLLLCFNYIVTDVYVYILPNFKKY